MIVYTQKRPFCCIVLQNGPSISETMIGCGSWKENTQKLLQYYKDVKKWKGDQQYDDNQWSGRF